MRQFIIIGLLCALSACTTTTQPTQGTPPASTPTAAAPAVQDGTVLCKGRLSIRLPAEWSVHVGEKETTATGPHGERFELVGLKRPPDRGDSHTPAADATLREFMALKAAHQQQSPTTKLWSYTIYQASKDYEAAWTAALSSGNQGGDGYAIQYLMADPGIIFMLTFDKNNVTEADMMRDKVAYDDIIKTAWRRESPMEADSPDCK